MRKSVKAVLVFTMFFYLASAWIAWDWLWFTNVNEIFHRAAILLLYTFLVMPIYLQVEAATDD